jgi:hypothetical protein
MKTGVRAQTSMVGMRRVARTVTHVKRVLILLDRRHVTGGRE